MIHDEFVDYIEKYNCGVRRDSNRKLHGYIGGVHVAGPCDTLAELMQKLEVRYPDINNPPSRPAGRHPRLG